MVLIALKREKVLQLPLRSYHLHNQLSQFRFDIPNHEFDDQLLCFELTTSLNSNEDVVKVMGADILLAVQAQAFLELTGLYRMQRKAAQDQKDYEEMVKMRQREYDIEAVRNDLIILNRFYPRGGIVAAHPSRVLYYQHDPHRYHPIDAMTRQYSPQSPIEPIPSGSNIRINQTTRSGMIQRKMRMDRTCVGMISIAYLHLNLPLHLM